MDFKRNWTAADAVLNLYFSDDGTVRKGGDRRTQMENTVRFAFVGTSHTDDTVTNEERATIEQIVAAIRTEQHATAKTEWHALLWLRWAIHRKLPHELSAYTLRRFSSWRADPGLWQIRYKNAKTGMSRGKLRHTKTFGETHGFTLDEFLLCQKLRIENDADPFKLSWTLRWSSRIARPDDEAQSQSHRKKFKNQQAMRRDCGTNVLNEVIKCVTEAAYAGQPFLASKRTGGRFACQMSRLDLAEWLNEKYDTLSKYSPSTIARAISVIASCPKGNTRKSRPSL